MELLYEDVPDTLSQLIRTAFIPREGAQFLVADFSAIEACVIAWYADEIWRQKVFEQGGDIYCASATQMFKVPVEKHGINGHLRQKGKIAELALGYGGSVGALKAMGAIEMGLTEDELPSLVEAWRQANPKIVEFWWAVDRAVMEAVKYKHTTSLYGLTFSCRSGMLFITLPSGRNLAYVKPKVGINKFGGECITYEGVGSTKKWERLDSYGPKFVENIVQATARDILCYAMQTLRHYSIVMHVHDEVVIEPDPRMSLEAVCEQMGRTPPWAKGLLLRADGYATDFLVKINKIEPLMPVLPTRKKVAAYARVSTETERLQHSLSAQISYYSELIQSNPKWEYAGVYADDGITGTKSTRAEFQRLLQDCEDGKIDIILTKSISRFARNTVDLLETVRHLKELGIEVRFEKERINSLSGDGKSC